jgi:hypothetical protein
MSGADSEVIFSVEEAPEGGYLARALGYSIFTEADDLDALRDAVRDAVRCHFDDVDRPPSPLETSLLLMSAAAPSVRFECSSRAWSKGGSRPHRRAGANAGRTRQRDQLTD